MRGICALALFVFGVMLSGPVFGASRQVAVFMDGRMMSASSAKAFSCEDEGLAFVFSETINGGPAPQTLTLSEPERESGIGTVRVEITRTCGEGEAIFDYAHDSTTGSADDISIAPERFSLSVATSQGASASRTVNYQALEDGDSEEAEAFTLFGERIVFFVGDTAGQAMDRRELLEVRIPANSENVVEPDDLTDDSSEDEREAVDDLNEACRQAEPGSDLAATCDEMRESQDETSDDEERQEEARRIAREVDPSEVTEATAAALETIGRIQHENILNRLSAIRSGSRGVDVSSLTLAMNGHSLDMGWVQDYMQAEEGAGGGNRLLSDRWGVFLNGSISFGDQDFRQQSGYDFDVYDLTGGVDYRFDNGLVLGGAFGLTRFESDIDAGGGSLDSDALSVQGFGTVNLNENFYVDATIAYTDSDLDQTRMLNLAGIGSLSQQTLSGSTDSTQFAASLSLNYQTAIGAGWSLVNYGSLYFADTEVDSLTEQGGGLALSYEERQFDSLLSSLGVRVSKVFNFENGVMTTFADVSYKHESKDKTNVNTRFAAVDSPGPTVLIEDPDKNFGSIGLGGTWVFPSGNQLFLKLNSLVLDDSRTRNSIYVGTRIEF